MEAPEILLIVGGVLALVLPVATVFLMRRLRCMPRRTVFSGLRIALGVTGRVLLVVGPLVLVIWLVGALGLVWGAIAFFVVIDAAGKRRAAQQYGLLWLLTVSAEREMPLAPAVEAFARERGGRFGHRARKLAEMLRAGVALPDAVDRCRGLLPPEALPMVRVGCESGALAAALRQATKVYTLHDPLWTALCGKIAYVLFVPTVAVVVLTFIMLKIVPAFQKIFADFGTTLPPLTQLLISVSNGTVGYWFLFSPLFLLAAALLLYALLRYFGWIHWDPPGIERLTRRFHSAQVLDSLALVARRQRPLHDGITALAQSYPVAGIRRRLHQVAADIESGGDWCDSLRRRGLIRPAELAILQAAQRVGNLPWALTEMADSARRRLVYRVQAIVQMLFPPIVVVIGLTVMFVVVALFLPPIKLIQKLS